jgi:uncharacterized protein YutE (UPF0331/DUF86 family)
VCHVDTEGHAPIGGRICGRLQYPPHDARDAFDCLTAAGPLPADGADRRHQVLRFRNRVVHGYPDVDDRKVFAVLRDDLGDIADTLAALEAAAGGG